MRTVSLRASQAIAGGPISIGGSAAVDALADDNFGAIAVLLTTTPTPPATFAAATASVSATDYIGTSPYWDSFNGSVSYPSSGGVPTSYSDRQSFTRIQHVDGTFAVGRYLWLAMFASNTPAGGDAPLAIAGPYLIR